MSLLPIGLWVRSRRGVRSERNRLRRATASSSLRLPGLLWSLWTRPSSGSPAVFLSMTYLLWAGYVLASHQSLAGWEASEAWILALNGTFFVVVAWRVWRRSRAWALIGLVVMGAEFAGAQINLGRPNGFAVVPLVLLLSMLNATRGAFAFHKYGAYGAKEAL